MKWQLVLIVFFFPTIKSRMNINSSSFKSANTFSISFLSNVHSIKDTLEDIESVGINFNFESASQSIYLVDSSVHKIISIIQNLKPKQICGIDDTINIFLLKSCFIFDLYLKFITSLSFKTGLCPNSLK